MGLQPSASRTALLLACPRPFDPSFDDEPDLAGEAARYGSAFHQVIAACLRSPTKKPLEKQTGPYAKAIDRAGADYDVRRARVELFGHVKSSVKVLRNWLAREELEVSVVEEAHAIDPRADGSWGVRAIPPHDEDHRYVVNKGELPGTIDLVAASKNKKRKVVLDHKTGSAAHGFAVPSKIPQMRTLGLVTGSASEVGIFHADRRGLPVVYAEPYTPSEQRAHVVELHQALALVGSGFLRPGKHCEWCPKRLECPAHAADLLAESSVALVSSANALAAEPITGLLAPSTGASVEVRAGALYELLRKFRVLEKAGTEEIKRLIKAGVAIETRDGKVLAIQTQTFETLSKKSVLEALGPVAGEKELKRLREKGAVRESTREKIIGEK